MEIYALVTSECHTFKIITVEYLWLIWNGLVKSLPNEPIIILTIPESLGCESG